MRQAILDALGLYSFKEEVLERFFRFIEEHEDCFERSCKEGHLTASTFILSADYGKVLLTLHAKLHKWMQLGGHADGHPLLHEAALREAKEESGIETFAFHKAFGQIPFDIDIHEIPANAKEEAHLHYDVRYLLIAPKNAVIVPSYESKDLKWVPLAEVPLFTVEESVLRPLRKIYEKIIDDFNSRSVFYEL
jgi:8-oxo-dGTP pyrophosphatase MutT (NUDIX family)